MTHLPPSPFFDSAAIVERPADEAAASPPQPRDAAADIPDDDISNIGEIFVGARKMFDPDPAGYTNADQAYYDLLRQIDNPHERDLPDVPQGLVDELEPMPLFLRQAV